MFGAQQLTAAFSDTRTIAFTHIHTKETISVLYKRNGSYVPEAMDKIDWIMRDWRRNEKTKMDPHTIDILWEMHTELGSKEPIQIICGYRSRSTNEMLRKTVGGQASESQHITGKAIDVTFPDVSLKQIRYSALIREQGGVGYYPTSGIPFVHVDTGRVRHWPRLPRYELALLFPNGKSQHHPADGSDITRDDVRIAQAQHKDLATQIAGFFTLRQQPKDAIMVADASSVKPDASSAKPATPIVTAAKPAPAPKPEPKLASLTPQLLPQPKPVTAAAPPANPAEPKLTLASAAPAPKLVSAPKLVERSSRFTPGPNEADRSQLMTLVSFVAESSPKLVSGPVPVTRRNAQPLAAAQPVTGSANEQLAFAEPITPRTRWTQVAALDPKTFPDAQSFPTTETGSIVMSDANKSGWSNGWVAAPAYDEEHPEELSYRPFPLAPMLTESASVNEPVLARMSAPDVSKILANIDKTWTVPEMQFLPGQQTAEVMWAQQFQGHPVQYVDASLAERGEDVPTNLIPRSVKTAKLN